MKHLLPIVYDKLVLCAPRLSSHLPTRHTIRNNGNHCRASAQGAAGETDPINRSDPWQLFDRMIKEERIPLGPQQKEQLIIRAAANASGLSEEVFSIQFQELLILVPDLQPRILRMLPKLLAELVKDTDGVASRLIELKLLFPGANIAEMVSKRPSILLDQEFQHVPAAATKLKELFGEPAVDRMVQTQPLLLLEDIEGVLEELNRLFPGRDPLHLLRSNPDLLLQVMSNVKLSIW